MWKIKEDSRREVLLGVPTAADRIQLVRQTKQQGDVRRWIKRVQHKVGYLQHVAEDHQDIDQMNTVALLHKPPLPPTQARTRLRRTTASPKTPTPSAPKIRWRTTIQHFFPLYLKKLHIKLRRKRAEKTKKQRRIIHDQAI